MKKLGQVASPLGRRVQLLLLLGRAELLCRSVDHCRFTMGTSEQEREAGRLPTNKPGVVVDAVSEKLSSLSSNVEKRRLSQLQAMQR